VCVRLNLYQHRRVNETADLDHGCRRTDSAKKLAMCLAHLFPVLDVDDIHARPYHMGDRRSRLSESRLNSAQSLDGLRIRVSNSDHPCGCHGRCPRHMHVRTHPNSTRIPDTRLPGTTTGDVQTLHHRCPPDDCTLRQSETLFLICPPHSAQDISNFTNCSVGPHNVYNRRHDILITLRHV